MMSTIRGSCNAMRCNMALFCVIVSGPGSSVPDPEPLVRFRIAAEIAVGDRLVHRLEDGCTNPAAKGHQL